MVLEKSSGSKSRHSKRIKGYDYTQPGAYFVTICTKNRQSIFGRINDGEMHRNDYGDVVFDHWIEIPEHFRHIKTDSFVIMPNHLHGILLFEAVGARHAVPLQETHHQEGFGKPVSGALPTVIRSFKSSCTRHINELKGTPGATLWQRNYYEHIIRTDHSLKDIRRYIDDNPIRWDLDPYNPDSCSSTQQIGEVNIVSADFETAIRNNDPNKE